MTLQDLVGHAAASLLAHRLRATLSAIGVVFGVATVMTALAIGEGARHRALEEIASLGIDNVIVRAIKRQAAGPVAEHAPELRLADAVSLRRAVPDAVAVGALRTSRSEIRTGTRRAPAAVAGVTREWIHVAEARVRAGRWLVERDQEERRRVAILGAELARVLYGSTDPLGDRVYAAGEWYRVIGVLLSVDRGASRVGAEAIDRCVIVPLGALDVSLGAADSVDRVAEIVLRVAGGHDVERAGEAAGRLLDRRHPRVPGAAKAYEIVVPRELLRARLRAQRTFNAVLLAVGALALLISGIGVMNIMLASVAERTQEIGVRRACGARRRDIVLQFAVESSLLCGAGGVAGLMLGAAFAWAVATAAGWPVALSVSGIAMALALASATGLAFGTYPACLAARLDPVDALRA